MSTTFEPQLKGFFVYYLGEYMGTIETTRSGAMWFPGRHFSNINPRMSIEIESDVNDKIALMCIERRLKS